MPEDRDWEVYKVPPTRTPVSERTTSVPNPATFFQTVFNYVVDAPVTFVRGTGGPSPPRPPPLFPRGGRVPSLAPLRGARQLRELGRDAVRGHGVKKPQGRGHGGGGQQGHRDVGHRPDPGTDTGTDTGHR